MNGTWDAILSSPGTARSDNVDVYSLDQGARTQYRRAQHFMLLYDIGSGAPLRTVLAIPAWQTRLAARHGA